MSANSKCPQCGKTVYFAERSTFEGQDYHSICLIQRQKQESSIHNKGFYGLTPQDPSVVHVGGHASPRQQQPAQSSGTPRFCSNCGAGRAADAKFCPGCGTKF
eukprot:TRINITY_DN5317_c0_g1_i1.p1 TRINITY_DN5317_c0_g1~~TRINITY_DN5317_c0_g1_i1.p1  ORF type:complete len:110 (-),score=11.91 TRINITY_DN5317_c0_g1_i1:30-338(-)